MASLQRSVIKSMLGDQFGQDPAVGEHRLALDDDRSRPTARPGGRRHQLSPTMRVLTGARSLLPATAPSACMPTSLGMAGAFDPFVAFLGESDVFPGRRDRFKFVAACEANPGEALSGQ